MFGRHAAPEGDEQEGALSAEEYLFTYLRTLEARGGDLPRGFLDRLRRALSHFGIDSLDPTPALRESLLWMFKSHRSVDQQADAIAAVLGQRLLRGDAAEVPGYLPLLDRLIAVSRNRHQAVWDVARDVRYCAFDRPGFDQSRRGIYATMEAHLSTLARDPYGASRGARIAALVDCPQPLKSLFAPRFEQASPAVREVMLEVLTRRFYSIRSLGPFASFDAGDGSVVVADYPLEGRRIRVAATETTEADLPHALETLQRASASLPEGHDVVIDVHVWTRNAPGGRRDGLLRSAPAAGPGRVRPADSPCRGDGVGTRRGGSIRPDPVLHVPAGAVRFPRAEVVPGHPPDDRQAPGAVAAAGISTWTGCRRSRTSTCSTAWPARTRRTSGCSCWRRSVMSRPYATATAGWWSCRTSGGCSWSRSRPSGGSR